MEVQGSIIDVPIVVRGFWVHLYWDGAQCRMKSNPRRRSVRPLDWVFEALLAEELCAERREARVEHTDHGPVFVQTAEAANLEDLVTSLVGFVEELIISWGRWAEVAHSFGGDTSRAALFVQTLQSGIEQLIGIEHLARTSKFATPPKCLLMWNEAQVQVRR